MLEVIKEEQEQLILNNKEIIDYLDCNFISMQLDFYLQGRLRMNNLKTVSIIALIMSVITMIGGIGIVIYYVNNLPIIGLSIFILIMSATMVSRTVSLIFKEIK